MKLIMKQEEIDADRARWKEVRRKGVTASEMASVLGLGPTDYSSAWAVYAAKITGSDYDADTDATLRGTHLEGYTADRYAKDYDRNNLVMGGLYASTDRPWQMATFDRLDLSHADPSPVQIKTSATYERWGDHGSDTIPVHYRVQCLQEMDVADSDEVLLPCLFVHTWELRVYRIVRDKAADADITRMREAGEEFLGRVERQDPPAIDWTPATTKALRTLHPVPVESTVVIPIGLARRYRAARLALDAAEERLGQAVNEMLFWAGDAKYLMTSDKLKNPAERGAKVATRLHYPKTGGYDTKRAVEDHPRMMAKYKRPDRTVDSITPGKFAKQTKEKGIRE